MWFLNHFKSWSLTKRILVAGNFLSVILMLSLAFFMTKLTKESADQSTRAKVGVLVSFLKKASGTYIWNFDTAALVGFSEEILKDPDIDFVNFFDKDDKSLLKLQSSAAGSIRIKEKIIDPTNGPVGTLELGYNTKAADTLVAKSQQVILFLTLIAQLILSIGLYLVVQASSKRLSDSMGRLRFSAKDALSTSRDLTQSSKELSYLASEQAAAVQETAATLNEITEMVNATVKSATISSELGTKSMSVASDGRKVVNEMISSIQQISESNQDLMSKIEESNKQFAEVVRVITEIAAKTQVINDIVFQTKLLSFNASVEAARAGENGKGFSVVAEEVGSLAKMSGQASTEIAQMLQSSIQRVQLIVESTKKNISTSAASGNQKVQQGIIIAQNCGKIIEEIVQNVGSVKSLILEITSASKEQAQGVQNISQAMTNIDQAANKNANTANDTSGYSLKMSQQADDLYDIVALFEKEVLGIKAAALRSQNSDEESANTHAEIENNSFKEHQKNVA